MPKFRVTIAKGGEKNPFTGNEPPGYREIAREFEDMSERLVRGKALKFMHQDKELKKFKIIKVEVI